MFSKKALVSSSFNEKILQIISKNFVISKETSTINEIMKSLFENSKSIVELFFGTYEIQLGDFLKVAPLVTPLISHHYNTEKKGYHLRVKVLFPF